MNDLYVCTFYTFRNSSIVSLVMNFLQYAGIGAGGLVATVAAVDYMLPWLKHDLHYIRKLVSAKRMMDAFESSNSLLSMSLRSDAGKFLRRLFLFSR